MQELRLINTTADPVSQTVNKKTDFIPFLYLNCFLNQLEKEFESLNKISLASTSSHSIIIVYWMSGIEGSGNRTCERKN